MTTRAISTTTFGIAVMTPMLLAASASGGVPIQLNEVRIDDPGNAEFVELKGPASASLDGLTFLVIGEAAGSGSGGIEEVTSLTGQSLNANGLFFMADDADTFGAVADLITNLNLENSDNLTLLLVQGFTGSLNDDLDADNDGMIDEPAPWTAVLDAVGMIEEPNPPSGTEFSYGKSLGFEDVGPDPNNGNSVPNYIYRCTPDGRWTIGYFDGDNAAAVDSPGQPNAACPPNLECNDRDLIGEGFTPFNNTDGTTNGPTHACLPGDGQIYNDLWYEYTPTCTGEVTVSTCGSVGFDSRIAIYDADDCPVGDASLLACNDDATDCGGGSSLTAAVSIGTTYIIRVGGATAGDAGPGALRVAFTPSLRLQATIPGGGYDPGDPVIVQLTLVDLCGLQAAGFQAFLQFDCDQLAFVGGLYTIEPFGLHIISPIVDDGEGRVDLAAGINQFAGQSPTTIDSVLAVLQFTAQEAFAVQPDVAFRPNEPPSRATDENGEAIEPLTFSMPPCPEDVNHDEQVNVDDLIAVILAWGTGGCGADVNYDGIVDVDDLLAIILKWGPCP